MSQKLFYTILSFVILASFVASQTEMVCNQSNNGRHFSSGVNWYGKLKYSQLRVNLY